MFEDLVPKYFPTKEKYIEVAMGIDRLKIDYGYGSQKVYDKLMELLKNDPHNPFYVEELYEFYVIRFELDKAREVIKMFPVDYPEDMIEHWEIIADLDNDVSRLDVYLKVYLWGNKKVIPEDYLKKIESSIFERS